MGQTIGTRDGGIYIWQTSLEQEASTIVQSDGKGIETGLSRADDGPGQSGQIVGL